MTQTTAAPPAAPPTDDAAPPSAPAARPLPEPKITLAQLDQDFLKDCDAETRDPTDVSEGGEPRVFFARLHQLVLHVAVLRRTVTYHEATIAGSGWRVEPSVGESCGELSGRRVGLVGFGDIAQRLGAVLTALGAEVHHHSRCDDRPGWLPLDDLLATSDVVSLHLPLTEATAGLIDRRRLALLPDRAVIVNTARGGLLDLDALADELVAGRLGGAGLDVFMNEPKPDPAFLRLDNVMLLPHVGSSTVHTRSAMAQLVVDNKNGGHESLGLGAWRTGLGGRGQVRK